MRPIVSVIIPCYNQGKYLDRALQSVMNQSMTDWECIIVNDGSSDNSETTAQAWVKRDNRFHYFVQTNLGAAAARNLGLQHANGKYIQLLDADDYISSDKFAQQVTLMDKHDWDISYTDFCFTDGHTNGSVRANRFSLMRVILFWGIGCSIPIHAFMYKKQFIDDHQIFFQPSIREDWDFPYRYLTQSPKIGYLKHYCGAMYFQNATGVTGSPCRMQKGNFEFLLEEIPSSRKRDRWAWYLRLSSELWIYVLRFIKTGDRSLISAGADLFSTLTHCVRTIVAILLLPLSIIPVLVYFIRIYLLHND